MPKNNIAVSRLEHQLRAQEGPCKIYTFFCRIEEQNFEKTKLTRLKWRFLKFTDEGNLINYQKFKERN